MASALKERLDSIKAKGGVKGTDLAQILDTTPQTISRWATGKTEPQPNALQRVLYLEWLIDQLSEFYGPKEARLWLFAPHPLLGGVTPAACIKGGGIEQVLALIDQLRDGAYV